MVPTNISSGPNAMACVNNGIDPSTSPAASAQYQKDLWFPVLVMGIRKLMDIPQQISA
jgi:hypothetical protein